MSEHRTLDDHDAITAVLVSFARALDEKNWDGYASLYAVDCVLSTPRATHRRRAGAVALPLRPQRRSTHPGLP